jgi:hypothetical protein
MTRWNPASRREGKASAGGWPAVVKRSVMERRFLIGGSMGGLGWDANGKVERSDGVLDDASMRGLGGNQSFLDLKAEIFPTIVLKGCLGF